MHEIFTSVRWRGTLIRHVRPEPAYWHGMLLMASLSRSWPGVMVTCRRFQRFRGVPQLAHALPSRQAHTSLEDGQALRPAPGAQSLTGLRCRYGRAFKWTPGHETGSRPVSTQQHLAVGPAVQAQRGAALPLASSGGITGNLALGGSGVQFHTGLVGFGPPDFPYQRGPLTQQNVPR